jgi:hypothetical protein
VSINWPNRQIANPSSAHLICYLFHLLSAPITDQLERLQALLICYLLSVPMYPFSLPIWSITVSVPTWPSGKAAPLFSSVICPHMIYYLSLSDLLSVPTWPTGKCALFSLLLYVPIWSIICPYLIYYLSLPDQLERLPPLLICYLSPYDLLSVPI